MTFGAYSLSEWTVIACYTACVASSVLRFSADARAGLSRLRELFLEMTTVEKRSELGRNMTDERRLQHLELAIPLMLLFWHVFAIGRLLGTVAGIRGAINLYGDVCILGGFCSTFSAQAGLAQRSRLRLTKKCEFTCWYAVHVVLFFCIVLCADNWGSFVYLHTLTFVPRLGLNMTYLRGGVASGCTILHSALQVAIVQGVGVLFQPPSVKLHVGLEGATAMIMVVAIVFWERLQHWQIRTEILNATTQGEATASRRLLNTICDATFELDDKLSIADEAAQLAGMLQLGCHRSLRGVMVESLVLQQDREYFRERITAAVPDDQEMANVFNLSLSDSLSNAISVEVFHVPVHSPSAYARHLIGVRELVDLRDTVDRELPTKSSSHQRSQIGSRHSNRSRRSGSRKGTPPASPKGTPAAAAADVGFCTDVRDDRSPLAVKFYADSMDVLDATGAGAEACMPGSCLRSVLQPDQDLFTDIQMGCHALRDMLLSDPDAHFQFRCVVEFSRGVVHKTICDIVLRFEDAAREGSTHAEPSPIVATLHVVGPAPGIPRASQASEFEVGRNATNARGDSSSEDSSSQDS